MFEFSDDVEAEFPVSDFHTHSFCEPTKLGASGRPVSNAANFVSYSFEWLWCCLIP